MPALSLGIDLGGTCIKAAVVDETGGLVSQRQVDTPPSREIPAVLEKLIAVCLEQIAAYPEIQRVGLGAPGLVSLDRRLIRTAPNFPTWRDVPLGDLLAAAVERPVLLENDVNCFGLAEYRYGAGRGFQHLIALAIGTGIGGAILLQGKLYRGASGAAAELGHISVDLWGRRCACGNWGCVEQYIGEKGFMESARTELGNLASPIEVSDLAKAADEKAIRFLEGRGEILGAACTTLIHIFDPEVIIIGGGIAQAGEAFFRGIRRAVRERAYPILGERVQILPAQLGTISGAIGAASIHLDV